MAAVGVVLSLNQNKMTVMGDRFTSYSVSINFICMKKKSPGILPLKPKIPIIYCVMGSIKRNHQNRHSEQHTLVLQERLGSRQ